MTLGLGLTQLYKLAQEKMICNTTDSRKDNISEVASATDGGHLQTVRLSHGPYMGSMVSHLNSTQKVQ